MATIKTLFNSCQVFKSKVQLISCLFVQQNGMSQYPNYFISPIYKKETIEELIKSGEAQKLAHIPTKAAFNNQTCSVTQDDLVNLFINYCMKDGLKLLARTQIEETFANIKRLQLEKYHKCKTEAERSKIELNPRVVFYNAIENCKPIMQLTPIKRGGVTYQVPVPVTAKQAQFLSMKWLLAAGKDKDKKARFCLKMAGEFIDASNNTGRVIKKKQDLHRQCEANRAYAHYRWS